CEHRIKASHSGRCRSSRLLPKGFQASQTARRRRGALAEPGGSPAASRSYCQTESRGSQRRHPSPRARRRKRPCRRLQYPCVAGLPLVFLQPSGSPSHYFRVTRLLLPFYHRDLTHCLNSLLLNWNTHQITPLSPRAVVILHILMTKQVFQSKPGMRTALPDTAVGDDFTASIDTLPSIKLFQ